MRGGESVGWSPRQSFRDRLIHRHGNRLPQAPDGRDRVGKPLRDDRLGGRPREGRLPGEHLVQQAAQTVDVAPSVECALARSLLGAHVRGRAEDDPRPGELPPSGRIDRPRDAEVGHDGLAVGQQDVFRLDVSMHDIAAVRIAQGVCHFTDDRDGMFDRELLFPIQPLTQRLPRHVRHDIVEEAVRLARVVQRQDVGMTETGGGFDLPEKPLPPEGGGELRRQHLDRDGTPVLQVVREVDRRHSPAPELALDRVAVCERGPQLGKRVGHRELLLAGSLHHRARRWARPGSP